MKPRVAAIAKRIASATIIQIDDFGRTGGGDAGRRSSADPKWRDDSQALHQSPDRAPGDPARASRSGVAERAGNACSKD